MDEYTIYCTESQTKKALELGAPIKIECFSTATEDHWHEVIPTAEQMIGWLEEQGVTINIEHSNVEDTMRFKIRKSKDFDYVIAYNYHYPSRREATLAAIDAAIEYLENQKQ